MSMHSHCSQRLTPAPRPPCLITGISRKAKCAGEFCFSKSDRSTGLFSVSASAKLSLEVPGIVTLSYWICCLLNSNLSLVRDDFPESCCFEVLEC